MSCCGRSDRKSDWGRLDERDIVLRLKDWGGLSGPVDTQIDFGLLPQACDAVFDWGGLSGPVICTEDRGGFQAIGEDYGSV